MLTLTPRRSRVARRAAFIAACGLLGAAVTSPPETAWRRHIAQQNAGYAAEPHAMLKIQDSVYLDEGESAVLSGRRGEAGSWRWQGGGPGVLEVHAEQGRLRIMQDGKAVNPKLLERGVPVDAGVDVVGEATQVSAGVQGWRVMVFNQRNPELQHFAGVSYFPYDASYVVQATLDADAALRPESFATSRGTTKRFFHVGDAHFTLQGHEATLAFYSSNNDPRHLGQISAFFTDDQSGQGTYAGGRYLDVELQGALPATLTLDFNLAYNPNCARSVHFTCPLAEDRLALAVRAGERDPHAGAGAAE